MVNEINESEFAKLIADKKNPLVIVDFFADWCGPCQMVAPILDSLAKKNQKINFAKINVDDAPVVSNKYEISSIPCIVFFKHGKETTRVVGCIPENMLQKKIDDYFK